MPVVDYCAAKAALYRLGTAIMAHYVYRTLNKGEMIPMNRHSELAGLERQHTALEREIESERTRPDSDDLKISELKRRKLHVKDEIERLRHADASVH